MIDPNYRTGVRLQTLPRGVKVLLTAFVTLVGLGYLAAAANIYLHHQDADLEEGMSPDDIRRIYHGLTKEVTVQPKAPMLEQVLPGGPMRKYLEKEGEEYVRVLLHWLQSGAKEEEFTREGLVEPGDPSPLDVLYESCVRCHNATSGDKSDVPYAPDRDSDPTYELVKAQALPPPVGESRTQTLPPMSIERLVHVTHAHIFTIPIFALAVALLFLCTGWSARVKALLTPIPMLAVVADIGSWWLARFVEPFVFVIAAAGAVFGTALALQIASILGSMWLGLPKAAEDRD